MCHYDMDIGIRTLVNKYGVPIVVDQSSNSCIFYEYEKGTRKRNACIRVRFRIFSPSMQPVKESQGEEEGGRDKYEGEEEGKVGEEERQREVEKEEIGK